ncbi:MAG: hypothetical protein ACLGI2_11280 [Acidimicrobiia bacterium]
MNAWIVTGWLLVAVVCGLVALARARHRRYLQANRSRVIKESLERARAKQRLQPREPSRRPPGPRRRPR